MNNVTICRKFLHSDFGLFQPNLTKQASRRTFGPKLAPGALFECPLATGGVIRAQVLTSASRSSRP
eukprot:739423-Prorocentrum_lima.AAC.1